MSERASCRATSLAERVSLLSDEADVAQESRRWMSTAVTGRVVLIAAWVACFSCGVRWGGDSSSSTLADTFTEGGGDGITHVSSEGSPFIQDYSTGSKAKRAFVMSAEHKSADQLWRVLALTQMLHRLSRYPIVLLTDIHYFPDGAPVAERLRLMGVDVRALSKDAATYEDSSAHIKLQAWSLTEFDKVVWVSADSIVYRGIDWLFEREWMWASRHDPTCSMQATEPESSLMVLYPNKTDYDGLLEQAKKGEHGSTDKLVSSYFADVHHRPVHLLSELEAGAGQCLSNSIPTPYRDDDGSPVRGAWSMPAFVQNSGSFKYGEDKYTTNNVCFSMHLDDQVVTLDNGKTRNVCHSHPLSAYWRDAFCVAAVQVLNVKHWKATQFCNDPCYYHGRCDDSRVLEVKQ